MRISKRTLQGLLWALKELEAFQGLVISDLEHYKTDDARHPKNENERVADHMASRVGLIQTRWNQRKVRVLRSDLTTEKARCSRCGGIKPIEEFMPAPSGKKKHAYCKACRREYHRDYMEKITGRKRARILP